MSKAPGVVQQCTPCPCMRPSRKSPVYSLSLHKKWPCPCTTPCTQLPVKAEPSVNCTRPDPVPVPAGSRTIPTSLPAAPPPAPRPGPLLVAAGDEEFRDAGAPAAPGMPLPAACSLGGGCGMRPARGGGTGCPARKRSTDCVTSQPQYSSIPLASASLQHTTATTASMAASRFLPGEASRPPGPSHLYIRSTPGSRLGLRSWWIPGALRLPSGVPASVSEPCPCQRRLIENQWIQYRLHLIIRMHLIIDIL